MNSKKGLPAVLAAIAIQLIVGIAYIWSVFQTGIANSLFGGDNAAAGLVFSLVLALLAIGSVIGGKLAAKYGTRVVVFAGGVILSAGFFFSSFATPEFPWLLWVTYGAMGGIGMGFTYSTTIACAQKWYPHRKGLVTGIIVSAIGIGGLVFTPIVEKLIVQFGGRGEVGRIGGELKTFIVLSAVMLVVCTLGSLFLKNPPEGHMADKVAANPTVAAKAAVSYSPMEMLKTPQYYLVTFTLLLTCMGGLMMIAFAKPIAEAKGLAETAAIGVLAISLSNSIGRLVWGMVSDKLGRKNTLFLLFAGSGVLSLFVGMAEGSFVFILIALIGFFYGGIIGTFPSFTADLFGAKHMATNYGLVLLGFGAGAIISSQIAGYYKNLAAEDISLMSPAFVIASCCAGAGIVMMLVLKAMSKKKQQS